MTDLSREYIDAERARELLRYDPESGRLFWRVSAGRMRAGTEAGTVSDPYYRYIRIDGRGYYAHRIAWLITTGAWPDDRIDHIDGDGFNNRWDNLRTVSHSVNLRNTRVPNSNRSGVMGVYWHKASGKWCAQIKVDGAKHSLGVFDDKEDAIRARKDAERKYDFHPNHGRCAQ